jgi:hypothetical protein
VFLALFIFIYADELPQIFDWAAWNAGALVSNVRLKLWKLWLYPRLRIETYLRFRRARARQKAIIAKEPNH